MRVASFYSGAGGLDEGFRQAGYDLGWANEADRTAAMSYKANLGDHILADKVEDVIASRELPDSAQVDVVIGGPPCQGFSVAGHMRPDDPRSKHVFTFMDLVKHLDPV